MSRNNANNISDAAAVDIGDVSPYSSDMPKRSFYEKTLSEKSLFKGRIFDLVRQVVLLPNRKTSTRDIIRHPGAVAMLPIDAKGRILLVRQYRKAAGREMLEIPAGTLDPGESPRTCAQRELQEEIGYKAGRIKLLTRYFPAAGYTTEIIHIYLATGLVPSKQKADEDEFLEVVAIPPKKLLQEIRRGRIRDSKTMVAMLFYHLLARV